MFRMYGRKVEILKYQVFYQENEKRRTDYAASKEEAQEIAARAGGSVSALTPGDDAWMDGIEVADVPNTYGEAMRVYEAGEAAYREQHPSEKELKIAELSTACEQAICAGLDIQLGEAVEHFNYSERDQINIKEMFDAVIMGATMYPYQSEDGQCRTYTAAEILTIYPALAGNKTGQLTYYHQLKEYINTLESVEEIEAVTYGQPLTGAYLEHYTQMMAVAQEQMGLILAGGSSQ